MKVDPLETSLETLDRKIKRTCDVETKYLVLRDRAEIHISITHPIMKKKHKNIRQTILDRVRKNHTLSHYRFFLLVNPRSTGRACTTFELNPRKGHWERGCTTMLPNEALVA